MKKSNTRFRTYFTDDEAGTNISWGSVFAGVITFLSIFMTLGLIGSAIGFGTLKPTSSNPLDGVGTGLIIWSIITIVLSLMAAGFVSGVAAKRIGLLHGFLTWATSMIAVMLLVSYTAVSTFSAIGSLLGNVASGVGDSVGAVASTTGDAISKGFDKVTDEIGTDVPELQPDYLKDQMSEATDKIKDAGKEIIKNPENADKVFDSTADSLQDQAKKIGDSVDKNAIANAVAKNSDLSQEEAQQATDNIYNELKTASDEAQKQIDTARTNLDKAKDDLKESIDEARQAAEDASNTTAKASIWGFVAMVVGLIITSLFGLLGANLVKNPEREHKM